MKCEHCQETVANNRWAKIRAHSAGWYFQRNGTAYCLQHRPHYAPPLKTDSGSTTEDTPIKGDLK